MFMLTSNVEDPPVQNNNDAGTDHVRMRMRSKSILKVHVIIDIPNCASHLLEVGPSVPIDEGERIRKKNQVSLTKCD